MISEIQFACLHCGQKLAVDSAAAGRHAPCPNCEGELVIPPAGEPEKWAVPQKVSDGDADSRARSGGHAGVEGQTLREEFVETTLAVGRLERELAELGAERLSLQGALELSRQRVSALDAQLGVRERDLLQAQAAMNSISREADALREEAGQLHREATQLAQTLEETSQDRAAKDAALKEAQQQLSELEEQLKTAEGERDSAIEEAEDLESENSELRSDLEESEAGRELLSLREQIKEAEAERTSAERARQQAEAEMAKVAEAEHRQKTDFDALLRRCEDAERRAEAVSEPQLRKDNEVLRGIINRQKADWEHHQAELRQLRRARLGLRIAYVLFGASLAGVIVLAIKILPQAIQAGGF